MKSELEMATLRGFPNIKRREFIQLALAAGATVAGATSFWSRAEAAAPKRGGILRIGSTGGSTTDTLDGAVLIDSHAKQVSWMFRNNLTEVDANGNVGGELTESWEASPNAKTWQFKLRKGVEFHDGKSLKPDDVIYSLNHHRGEGSKSGGKGAVSGIEDIKPDGDNGVVFTLTTGNADFPFLLADYHLPIVPAGTVGQDFDKAIGTGPYIKTTWDPGVLAAGKRNPNYFKTDRAFFDEVENLNITDAAARQNALLNKQLDAIESPNVKTLDLIARAEGVTLHEIGGSKHFTIPMRTNIPPFDNNDVRLALKYSIDRESLLKSVLLGHGYLGNDHPIGKNTLHFAKSLEQRAYDPEKAKFHLKKAGLTTLKVDLSAGEIFDGAVDTAVLFKEHARASGIDINVVREPADGYWDNVWNQKPFVLCFWDGRPTVDWMLSTAYESTAAWNDTVWKNARFDEILITARAELDPAKREQLYLEAQSLIRDEGGVIVPMFANYLIVTRSTIATPPKIAGNWSLDGAKAAERWWQA